MKTIYAKFRSNPSTEHGDSASCEIGVNKWKENSQPGR